MRIAVQTKTSLAKWLLLEFVAFGQLSGQLRLLKNLSQMTVDTLRVINREADLAPCLGTLGNVLRALGEREEARSAYAEALEIFWPRFLQLPKAFDYYFMGTLGNYLQIIGDAPDDPWYQLWQQMQSEDTG